MSKQAGPTSLCLIVEGPPIDQIEEVKPGDGVSDHTYYYVDQNDTDKVTRILHVLYYRSVERFKNGNGVTVKVVTANHNTVTILYIPNGAGAFLADSQLVESRRL